ncbi:hypothetical protein [Aeromonas enteropelogenes]|uniref:hypothetical protein n=1 Tax=Aeromonas enteropelogenes TaxID=29489 RepID=UPI003B9EEDB8
MMLLACYVLPLGMWGCTSIVTYIKSDTRNDNIQCEPDTSQIKFGKRSCIIIQQGKTTNGGTTTKAAVPTLATPASSAGGSHDK